MPKGMNRTDKSTDKDLPGFVAEAENFIASLFKGRGQYEKAETPTLALAREAAAKMEANSVTGRKAMVYAVKAGRQMFVPNDFVEDNRMPALDGGLPAFLDRKKNGVTASTQEERADYAKRSTPPAEHAPDPTVTQIDEEIAQRKKGKQAKRIALLAEQMTARDIPDKFAKLDPATGKIYDSRSPQPKEGVMGASKAKTKTNGRAKPVAKTTARRPVPKAVAKKALANVAKALDGAKITPRKVTAPRHRMTNEQRRAIEEAAAKGKLPPAPDFTADTHKPWRKKLEDLVALAKEGNAKKLKAYVITNANVMTTSPKALDRYRNLCVTALQARK